MHWVDRAGAASNLSPFRGPGASCLRAPGQSPRLHLSSGPRAEKSQKEKSGQTRMKEGPSTWWGQEGLRQSLSLVT